MITIDLFDVRNRQSAVMTCGAVRYPALLEVLDSRNLGTVASHNGVVVSSPPFVGIAPHIISIPFRLIGRVTQPRHERS